jgi:putative sporulation protein YyaC
MNCVFPIKDVIDKSRAPVFVCIGTMKHVLDSVAPRIGTILKQKGFEVIGTEEEQAHAKTLPDLYEEKIKNIDKSKYQVIAVDADMTPVRTYLGVDELYGASDSAIHPGKAVGKTLPPIGEKSIRIFVTNICDCSPFSFLFYAHDEGIEKQIKDVANNVAQEICAAFEYERRNDK